MEQHKGKAIGKKIAVGRLFYYKKNTAAAKQERIADVPGELIRLEAAVARTAEQLGRLYIKALGEVGEAEAGILKAQLLILEDPEYIREIKSRIEGQQMNAAYAVTLTGERLAECFAGMEDKTISARAADIRDITQQLVTILQGGERNDTLLQEPMILMAEDLSPSETVQMDKDKLLGFVTRHGSANSHTAILARTMNIPALLGVELRPSWDGRMAILDGDRGILTIDPDEKLLAAAGKRQEAAERREELLEAVRGKETVTRDGRAIRLYANIGSAADADIALQNDAEGIGLFRSEFLYLKAEDFPTEQEQFLAYRAVAERMGDKKVIIRTLDIGADKQADYFGLEKEDNPALGYRAIRICLTRQDIFRTQLRAILRASAYGNIAVMFPMIISLQELRQAKEILQQVREELRACEIPFREVEVGVMIETPAAVMISEELAKEADFFSIGTNDLTQYTLAIDRQNPRLDSFYDAHHPAVLRMIRMTVENGHKGGAWVGICGELGADLELTETFLDMRVDELSVSPSMVLPVRERIRNL